MRQSVRHEEAKLCEGRGNLSSAGRCIDLEVVAFPFNSILSALGIPALEVWRIDGCGSARHPA